MKSLLFSEKVSSLQGLPGRFNTTLFHSCSKHISTLTFSYTSAVNLSLISLVLCLWSCHLLISIMSALCSTKEEVTSNLPLYPPQLQLHLLGCQLKPLEQLQPHMGEASESEETWLPLGGCSLTALFIFNCQKRPANSQQSLLCDSACRSHSAARALTQMLRTLTHFFKHSHMSAYSYFQNSFH